MKKILFTLFFVFLHGASAYGQSDDDVTWVQVEARTQLASSIERAQEYAAQIVDVNGFALGGGWYAITLGPYARKDANKVLRAYKRAGLIPQDSFVITSAPLRQQFWPIGANVLERGVIASPIQPPEEIAPNEPAEDVTQAEVQSQDAQPLQTQEVADETKAQALRSERKLSRLEKQELQSMLEWAGFYTSQVDGLFGRGTRNAMAAWQEANNFEATGVMTTAQRAQLREKYNAILDGLGMAVLLDEPAGVEIAMPTAAVEFDKYSYPFALYKSANDIGAQVLLISQKGNRQTLFGLYDIMETLDLVPLNGPRELKDNSFSIVGENNKIISETHVEYKGGQVKGFTLIWPVGDEERRQRVIALMRGSMKRLDAVLDPVEDASDNEEIDLVAGLKIRTPDLSRSGFFIDGQGTVVTSAEAVASCAQITLDQEHEAKILGTTPEGIAILKPVDTLAPMRAAKFSAQAPRLKSKIAVGGYSYEGVLSGPSVTFGTVADLRDLQGDDKLNRLQLSALPGDIGGPVLDETGAVIGMLLPQFESNAKLPDDVSFSVSQPTLAAALKAAGKNMDTSNSTEVLAFEDISTTVRDMTVLVSCWN